MDAESFLAEDPSLHSFDVAVDRTIDHYAMTPKETEEFYLVVAELLEERAERYKSKAGDALDLTERSDEGDFAVLYSNKGVDGDRFEYDDYVNEIKKFVTAADVAAMSSSGQWVPVSGNHATYMVSSDVVRDATVVFTFTVNWVARGRYAEPILKVFADGRMIDCIPGQGDAHGEEIVAALRRAVYGDGETLR